MANAIRGHARVSYPVAVPFHFLGDSFVESATVVSALNAALPAHYPPSTFDGVGGTTLSQQADRFDLTPQYWGRQVVIINGGYDGVSGATLNTAYDRIAARCTLHAPLYVQPSPQEYVDGSGNRIAWDAADATVLAHVGTGFYCRTLGEQLAASDGSPTDEADVANLIWPTSCRSDNIHPNAKGAGIMAGSIYRKIDANGW